MGAAITGLGVALPTRVIDNGELAQHLSISEEWIFERTGIRSRHVVGKGETSSSLALEACDGALREAGVEAPDVDMVIVATSTPDYQLPATASIVQAQLGCTSAGAFDLGAACTGFLYALAQATALVESGSSDVVLVCGADVLSTITDYSDARSCVLFGDGAGAVVVQRSASASIGPFRFRSDGSRVDLLYVTHTERLIRMQGREVYRSAVESMTQVLADLLTASSLSAENIDLIVAHQANGRILEAVAGRLQVDPGRLAVNIGAVGNTSAASIPLALGDALEHDRLHDGDLVALTAFGAGFTWGAGLVSWSLSSPAPRVQARVPALVGTVGHLLEVL